LAIATCSIVRRRRGGSPIARLLSGSRQAPEQRQSIERFFRPLLAGWAYGAIYRSSAERTAALDGWLWHYNHRRRHAALGHRAPVSRTNLLGSYI
jgi:transposase InsO family protein